MSRQFNREVVITVVKSVGYFVRDVVRVSEVTHLTPSDETAFQAWLVSNRITDCDLPDTYYDYRGFWQMTSGARHTPGDHFPDTFKQHGHPTFSVESRYSQGPGDGGRWIGEKFIAGDGAGGSNAIVIRDCRVVFEIKKQSRGKEPNPATVTIYNLSQTTRALLAQKKLYVTIDAGSDGDLAQIYRGDLVSATSNRDNTEIVASLVLGDGHRAHNYARVSKSFEPGVSAQVLLETITKSMGLEVPQNFKSAPEMKDQFAGGMTMHGPATRELDRLLSPRGLSWSVQSGQLQILRASEVRADQAILVASPPNGNMISSPQLSPPEKGKKPKISVSMLLTPMIAPGMKIRVVSKILPNGAGDFKTEVVSHKGDSWSDNNWTTDVQAVML